MSFLLLGLSVVLSTSRNLLSKKLSNLQFGTKPFFLCQSVLFTCGIIPLLIFGEISFEISFQTLIYAIIYAFLLIIAQWFYTSALTKGNTALCATVYSLGFILPTLSGAIFWEETLSVLDILGIVCAVAVIVISGSKSKEKAKKTNLVYFILLIFAMLASGGLGIVQKIQQASPFASQKSIFLLVAFLISATTSLLTCAFTPNPKEKVLHPQNFIVASCIGVFFGCCNLLNTILAGLLDTAVFFPTLNICTILLSSLCATLFFREKIAIKEILVLILGGASILLLNLG